MLKKSLSQNLIKDKNLLRKMVDLAGITKEDIVVEIGAGQGDFTRAICEKAGKVFAVEFDRSFHGHLRSLESMQDNLSVIFDDFLRVPLLQFAGNGKIKVMGNIPYGITGPILFKLIEERNVISCVYLTTQKEIGDRIVSAPHRRAYGALSVVCQLLGDVSILLRLKAGVFTPPPRVDSVYFSMIFKPDNDRFDRPFIEFVKHCFEHKRKYLQHALSKHYSGAEISILYNRLGLAVSTRAEELEPGVFIEMYRILTGRDTRCL